MLSPLLLGLVAACGPATPPDVTPPEPTLRRLTQAQYTNAVHDVLGEGVVVPESLEPDGISAGLMSVGASLTTISPHGVEQYETAAYSIAGQVLADPELHARTVTCAPTGARDDDCAREVLSALGRRLWRRPLTDDELGTAVDLAGTAATALGGFDDGLEYGMAALLQSPNFLFRGELGEPDPDHPGSFRFTNYEMASRLSFLVWNTTPDDELLDAANAGDLTTDDGLAAEVDRLVADPRAKDGVGNLFVEMLHLADLDTLNKDPSVFVHMSPEVGPDARQETVDDLQRIVFDEDGDWRDFLTSRHTELDAKLAAIYGVPTPQMGGWAKADLPLDGPRAGYLGQVSFLALNAHPESSSATIRGKFIRTVLLCQNLPPPPANLNTAIPPVTADSPTLRDRDAVHLTDPFCASCHLNMDPIGLGLENFDGLGGFRSTENGAAIDPSGDLDDQHFDDALELGMLLHAHPRVGPCLVDTLFRYANGHVVGDGEQDALDFHADGLADHRYRFLWLLRDVATSAEFRSAGEVADADP